MHGMGDDRMMQAMSERGGNKGVVVVRESWRKAPLLIHSPVLENVVGWTYGGCFGLLIVSQWMKREEWMDGWMDE